MDTKGHEKFILVLVLLLVLDLGNKIRGQGQAGAREGWRIANEIFKLKFPLSKNYARRKVHTMNLDRLQTEPAINC
jgi:hypothetical protein